MSISALGRPRVWGTAAALIALPCLALNSALAHRPVLVRALVDKLESRFEKPVIADWSGITGLVVLGGNPDRTAEAMRLARSHPHLRIVLSGPGPEEVAIARRAPGIAPSRIEIELQSINTFGNAWHSKQHIAPRPGERWLLVTSASHMPRSIGSFLRVGFQVEPWPVADQWTDDAHRADVAQHEWLGLIAYWVRGRTIAILPGQTDIARENAPRREAPALYPSSARTSASQTRS